jgi:hypothetical protein
MKWAEFRAAVNAMHENYVYRLSFELRESLPALFPELVNLVLEYCKLEYKRINRRSPSVWGRRTRIRSEGYRLMASGTWLLCLVPRNPPISI